MCGIAGWVSYDGDLKSQRDVITTMTKTMARRGPDAGGAWIDRHAGLGHRRLAVIDLAGGAQPMQAEEFGKTTVYVIYNGEVYNFVELREELKQLGHQFKTRSDTEVVLRGYLQWGEEVAERLNGMFAFAIWDVRTEELFLIRDRMGVKPLFYYPTADGVLFGSEPKAILAHPRLQPRVTKDGYGRPRSTSPVMAQPLSRATSTSPLIHRSYGILWPMSAAITPKSSWTAGSLPIEISDAASYGQPTFPSVLAGTCTPHCTGFSKPFGLNQPWRYRVNQQTRSSVATLGFMIPRQSTRRRSPGSPPPVTPMTARKFLMPTFWSG